MTTGTTRRTLLLSGAAAVLETVAACSGSGGSRPRTATGSPASSAPGASGSSGSPAPASTAAPAPTTASASPSRAATSPSASPAPSALWTPNPGELEPDVKASAVAYVANRFGGAGLRVIDVQYGGLLDASASVLVVTGDGTFDVRLVQASPHWTVTAVNPSQPGPAAWSVSAAATAVLGDPRITLPPAAAADIRSGNVHDSVLTFLAALSQEHALDVSVVRSGHPLYVFGTSRLSDHPRGRAVDLWRIDGHAVVDPATPTALVDGVMRRAAALGAYNVGGPRQLSGAQFFSDRTHHDHVHVGFTG